MSSFAYETEIWAAIKRVGYARDRVWNFLWIESDSTYVVNLLRSKTLQVPWNVLASWVSCLDCLCTVH